MVRLAARPAGLPSRRVMECPTIPRRFDITATLCLAGATLCWGTAPVMLKYLSHADRVPDGFTSNLIRYPVGTLVYLPLLIHAARRGRLGRLWIAALLPTVVNIIGQTLWAWSFFHLDAAVVALLIRLMVVWAILGAFWLFPDERMLARSKEFWIGAALAIIGFAVMSGRDLALAGQAKLAGIAIIGLCSVFWGFYGVTVRYVMREQHPLVVFAIVGSYTSAGLVMLAPLGKPASVLTLRPFDLTLLIVSALIGISTAHGLYYVAVKRIGVAVSALTLSATPFVSVIGAWVFLGERLSGVQWAGGLVLATGSALALWSQQRLSSPPVPDPHEVGGE